MEKVFASVRSPLGISVAVARTSQSPFPLYASFDEYYRKQELNRDLKPNNKMKKIILCSFIAISILSWEKHSRSLKKYFL